MRMYSVCKTIGQYNWNPPKWIRNESKLGSQCKLLNTHTHALANTRWTFPTVKHNSQCLQKRKEIISRLMNCSDSTMYSRFISMKSLGLGHMATTWKPLWKYGTLMKDSQAKVQKPVQNLHQLFFLRTSPGKSNQLDISMSDLRII